MTTASTAWVDVFRGVAIVLGLTALALFPGTVVHRIHGWRSGLVGTIVALLFGSLIASTWNHLGNDHLKWYRSPVLLTCSILALVYVVSVRGWHIWTDSEMKGKRNGRPRSGSNRGRRRTDWR